MAEDACVKITDAAHVHRWKWRPVYVNGHCLNPLLSIPEEVHGEAAAVSVEAGEEHA